MRDPRASSDRANLPPDLAIVELEQKRKTAKELYRRYYVHNRPTWNLLRQANGEAPIEHVKPEMDL